MHINDSRGAAAETQGHAPHPAPTASAATPAPKSDPGKPGPQTGERTWAQSAPYPHGKGYAIRRSYRGHDLFLSGYKTASAAARAMNRRVQDIDDNNKPAGLGADRTSLAQALQDYGVARLPFLKGAEQEARRINGYLRPAGLRMLKVEELPRTSKTPGKSGKGAHFKVILVAHPARNGLPGGDR